MLPACAAGAGVVDFGGPVCMCYADALQDFHKGGVRRVLLLRFPTQYLCQASSVWVACVSQPA